ncbi:probable peptidoglycan muropeptide transporter SLC46 [Musca vetustissima]|uniref:probable peptidoglycan muropeptide transporter SLC46 n=1 Tax=Musca vetustissima TaxID=27455 RepID=UPI002AB7BB12|nr:probable peptidoglycan muropeptide transporter SLC46 [Musca vetustissima]
MVESSITLAFSRLKQLDWQKCFHMFHVEPIVFLLVFSHSLSGTIMRNEIIYQACTAVFEYNETDCQLLGTKNVSGYLQEIETEVQPYVANLFMIRTLLESIVPAFCGVFIGSWSDHYGRKPLLLISMIGFSGTYIIAAVIRELSQHYIVNPWYYVLAVVPHSILGGNCVFSVAAFCYISDVTDTKTRPYRMIILEACLSIGLMVGSLISSHVYEATNATITFSISAILMCLTTAYIAIYVPESLNSEAVESKSSAGNDTKEVVAAAVKCNEIPMNCSIISENIAKTSDNDKNEKSTKIEDNFHDVDLNGNDESKSKSHKDDENSKNISKEEKQENDYNKAKSAGLFSYIHIKEMWNTCFRERPYYDRCIILLVTGAMFLAIFVLDGAMTVFYLFVREKFQWTVRDFTYYETISHVTSMFGALVGFLILRKVFRMSVVTLALLAFLSDIFRSVIQGMAYAPWHLYLAIAAGSLKAVGGPMCRTIVSNIVPATDLGKIFSIKNILQSLAPFVAAPLYTVIYKASLTTFPGLFNVVSAALYFIAFLFILVVFRFKVTYKDHYGKMLK